ncbi:MAG: DUF167 domain-containing protein [Chloroflexota bacterium]
MARQENQPKKTSQTETLLALHVQPNAKRSEILGLANGVLRVRVAAPAKEGRANEALIDLLAALLTVPKARIRIVQGLTARNKVVAVQGLSQEEALQRLLAR